MKTNLELEKKNQKKSRGRYQTLWHLSCQGTGDGDECVLGAAVVDGHLFAPAEILQVAVALVTELVKTKAPVQ